MNMQVLTKSRKRPEPGDSFVYRMPGFDYGFGRVIRTDARMGSWSSLFLIYVYRAFAPDKATVPVLDKRTLLFPPLLLMDRGLWTCGYFETVARRSLTQEDVLKVHCFEDQINDCFVDEYERRLPRKVEPCGLHAVDSQCTVDVLISSALGLEPDVDTLPPIYYWQRVIKEWHGSGLNEAEFCRRRDIKLGSFAWWKRRLIAKGRLPELETDGGTG